MIIHKIPLLRGALVRWKNFRAKAKLFSGWNFFMHSVSATPIESILFGRDGCIYKLDDGRSYLFDPGKAVGWLYSIPFTGKFESKETAFIKNCIQEHWVCLDVGGCFGYYSVLFSKLVGKKGIVHTFEPVAINRLFLEKNIALNACSNVSVHKFALGEKQALTTIYVPEGGVSGSLRAHAEIDKCEEIQVEVKTLDGFANENSLSRVDFIKADIEGAELLMINGGAGIILKFRPIIMVEVQETSTSLFGYQPSDLFGVLYEYGYRSYVVGIDGGLIEFDFIKRLKGGLPDYNFIFIHKE
jgi:FkbM family methyltransferase